MHHFICTRASKALNMLSFKHYSRKRDTSTHAQRKTNQPDLERTALESHAGCLAGFLQSLFTLSFNIILSMSYEMHLKCMKLKAMRFSEPSRMIADTNALWSKFDDVKSENKRTPHTHFTFDRLKSLHFQTERLKVCEPQLCITPNMRLWYFSNDKCIFSNNSSGFFNFFRLKCSQILYTLAIHLAIQFKLPRSIQVNGQLQTSSYANCLWDEKETPKQLISSRKWE